MGTEMIIYPVWNVTRRLTSELPGSSCGGILEGNRPGKALQLAKIKMLSQPETSFPFSWAGFVLIGE